MVCNTRLMFGILIVLILYNILVPFYFNLERDPPQTSYKQKEISLELLSNLGLRNQNNQSFDFRKSLPVLSAEVKSKYFMRGIDAFIKRRLPKRDISFFKYSYVTSNFTIPPIILKSKTDQHFSVINEMKQSKDDIYMVTTDMQYVYIYGNTASAITRAFGAFYTEKCGLNLLSWSAKLLNEKYDRSCFQQGLFQFDDMYHKCKVKFRYYQNVCTASYSMMFWNKSRWLREIDWMALHGINFALALTGQEYIWQRLYEKVFDIAPEELDFFTGPVYLSWHRMGNLQRLHGPMNQTWMFQQLKLQHFILKHMTELGISPILPGFNGHIPQSLVNKNKLRVDIASEWSGFNSTFSALPRLPPDSPLFLRIGVTFVRMQLEEYHEHLRYLEHRYYSVDTYNEMNPDNNVAKMSKAIYSSLSQADSNAVWVMQMWCFAHDQFSWSPSRVYSFLSQVPSDRIILLDLHGDKRPQFIRLNSVFGKLNSLVIWCLLHNFGGSHGLAGEVDTYLKLLNSSINDGNAIGVGLAMEGIEQNEIIYVMVVEYVWFHENEFKFETWLKKYITARYHNNKQQLDLAMCYQAWICAYKTVYSRPNAISGWGNTKSIIEQRPWFQLRSFMFQPTHYEYEPEEFLICGTMLLEALIDDDEKSLGSLHYSSYTYDLIDFFRQSISDYSLMLSETIDSSYFSDKFGTVLSACGTMQKLIQLMDDILSCHHKFRIYDNVLSYAETFDHMRQSKLLMTRWDDDARLLHSYASKQYNDLVINVYGKRWKQFCLYLTNGKTSSKRKLARKVMKAYDQIEWQWINNITFVSPYKSKYCSMRQLIHVANKTFNMLTDTKLFH